MHMRKFFIGFLSLAAAMSLLAAPASFAAKNELPAVSPEGLKLVKSKNFQAVYMRDGADFSGYDKVYIVDVYVAFHKDWQRDYNMSTMDRVTPNDIARIKAKLAAEFKKVFTEELTKRGQTVLTDPTAQSGPDVLILRPAIINLEITAPDTRSAGMTATIAESAGQMTLYLDVYDGVTSDLLARVMDAEADRGFGAFSVNNEMTNRIAADKILKKWADILGDYLASARADK